MSIGIHGQGKLMMLNITTPFSPLTGDRHLIAELIFGRNGRKEERLTFFSQVHLIQEKQEFGSLFCLQTSKSRTKFSRPVECGLCCGSLEFVICRQTKLEHFSYHFHMFCFFLPMRNIQLRNIQHIRLNKLTQDYDRYHQ